MPKLIVLVGPPASGKSTWREKFLSTQTDEWIICSTDDLVEKWAKPRGLTYDEAFSKVPWGDINHSFKNTLKKSIAEGKNVIVDRTSMGAKVRKDYLRHLPAEGYEAEAVVFVVDDAELRRRLDERAAKTGKTIPEYVMKSMNARYQAPSKEEGFHKITYVRM